MLRKMRHLTKDKLKLNTNSIAFPENPKQKLNLAHSNTCINIMITRKIRGGI